MYDTNTQLGKYLQRNGLTHNLYEANLCAYLSEYKIAKFLHNVFGDNQRVSLVNIQTKTSSILHKTYNIYINHGSEYAKLFILGSSRDKTEEYYYKNTDKKMLFEFKLNRSINMKKSNSRNDQIFTIPESEVKVAISYCKKCNGGFRFAVEHQMDKKDFYKEVEKYDLLVKTVSLNEYQTTDNEWCSCS